MNRCLHAPKGLFPGLTALLVSATSLAPLPVTAQEFVRQFPAAARRASLEVTSPPNVLLNGQAERLSPGARIMGPNNQLVMSGTLVGQRVLVNYLRDPQGLVHEVWILSEAQARQKRSGMAPVTNFVFDSQADQPKADDGKTPFDQLPKYPQQ